MSSDSNTTAATKVAAAAESNGAAEGNGAAVAAGDALSGGNIPTTVVLTTIIEELITTLDYENNTDEFVTDDMDVIKHSPMKMAFVAAVLSLIIILTIGGNVLVVLSPMVSHRLRTVTYTFLVSLAIADLLLGITVLPWSAIYTISSEWPFSVVFCNIYISCDVMFCTASILHLLVISLERYFAITRPYAYQRKMNHKKAWIVIIVVWVVSLGVSFLPLHLGWNTEDGSVQNYDHPSQCILTWNLAYSLFDGIVLFFLPLILMLFVYARIVTIAYQQAKSIKKMMVAPAPSTVRSNNPSANEKQENTNNNHKGVVDEHKAVKIIAVVMGSFVVCWVPYFTMFTFGPIFNWNISDLFYQIVLWLGYINSLINPLVYACMNREFRRAFKTILSCARWDAGKCIRGSFGSRDHDSQIKSPTMNQSNQRYNGSVVTYTTKDTSTDTISSTESLPRKPNDIYMKLYRTQDDIAEDSAEYNTSTPDHKAQVKQQNGSLDVEIGRQSSEDHEQQESTPSASPTSSSHKPEDEPSSGQVESEQSEEPEKLPALYISENSDDQDLHNLEPATHVQSENVDEDREEHHLLQDNKENDTQHDEHDEKELKDQNLTNDNDDEHEDQHLLQDNNDAPKDETRSPDVSEDIQLKDLRNLRQNEIIVDVQ